MQQNPRISARRSTPRLLAIPLVVAAFALLASCGSDSAGSDADKPAVTTTTAAKGSTDTTGPSLDGASFVSDSVTGYKLVKDTQLMFTFTGDSLSVNAGCNNMNASYALKDDVLKWTSVPAATMMACEPDLMAQDQWITGLLTEGMDAEVTEKTLTLTSGDVVIELKADVP